MAEVPKKNASLVIKNRVGFIAGIAVFLFFLLMPLDLAVPIKRTLGLLLLCAVWWGTEAVPVYATAFFPGFLLPLLGILPLQEALHQYAHRMVFLFMGGFFIARAMVKWGIDRRIALNILSRAGTNPHALLFYFMVVTAFLSAFISNTATAAMMLPVGLSILLNSRIREDSRYGTSLMLGIAYGATIGGVATLVGTPPNVILAGFAETLLNKEITFIEWLKVGMPFSVFMLPLTWGFLSLRYRRESVVLGAKNAIEEERKRFGSFNNGEKMTTFVFALVALLWITRSFWHLIPCAAAKTVQSRIDDSTIAILCALLLFIVPVDLKKWKFTLEWKDTRAIPWGILILFGSGLCLGKGLFASGTAEWIAHNMPLSSSFHPLLFILIIAFTASFFSEFASNSAITNMMVPILVAVSTSLGVSPYLLIIPAAAASSIVFMLPIGTPPNAIVYGSGYINMADMIKAGFWIHLIGLAVMTVTLYFITGRLFGFIPV